MGVELDWLDLADMPSGNLPLDRAIRDELVSPKAGRRSKMFLLSVEELKRRGIGNIYLAGRAWLLRTSQLAAAAPRSGQMTKALKRSIEKAMKAQLRSAARDGGMAGAPHKREGKRKGKPVQVTGGEYEVTAWHWRMVELERQMRELQSRADALVTALTENSEPRTVRPWARRHYVNENLARAQLLDVITDLKAISDRAASAADRTATLKAAFPKIHGKFDAYFMTFINEWADFCELVTGKPPPPNGNAFEALVAAALETLNVEEAYTLIPGLGTEEDRSRSVERLKRTRGHVGDKAKQTSLNSKIRTVLGRRRAEIRSLQASNLD